MESKRIHPKRQQVLVAEDNRSLRVMITTVLCKGYKITSVDNGDALEEELREGRHDLAICDLNLPLRSSGMAIRRAFHDCDPNASQMPIIILTGMDADDPEVTSVRRMVNVQDIMFKPIGLKKLAQRVDELLGNVYSDEVFAEAESRLANVDASRCILVVDDEAEIRDLISLMLEPEGYQIRACASIERAISLCAQENFDLILTDYLLEEDVADRLLDELKNAAGDRSIPPTLLISGFADTLSMERYSEYPFVKGILPKPVSRELLLREVRSTMALLDSNDEASP